MIGFSVVSNLGAHLTEKKPKHEDVINNVKKGLPAFTKIMDKFLPMFYEDRAEE